MLRPPTYPLHELLAVLVDDALRELDLAKADILVHLLRVLGVERTPPAAHLEQEDTETPEVDQLRVPVLVEQHLRGEVLRRAAERIRELV